jgi:hypothetical protein
VNAEQWLSSRDPIAMVEFLRGSPTSEDTVTWWNNRDQFAEPCTGNDRKFRLFACACCRSIWERIPEPCNRDAVVALEEFLEGRRTGGELERAFQASSAVEWNEDGTRRSEPGYWAVKYLGRGFYKMTAAASALLVAAQVLFMADEEYGREARREFDSCYYAAGGVFLRPFEWPLPVPAAVEVECETQAAWLRCLFGDAFRPPPAISPFLLNWNDGLLPKLAQSIYDRRSFDELPLLADALEDAACQDAQLLGHLRSGGLHARGCFAVDALLNKS